MKIAFRYPAVVLLGAVLGGTLSGWRIALPGSYVVAIYLVVLCGVLAAGLVRGERLRHLLLLAAFALITLAGASRYFHAIPGDDISHLADSESRCRIEGRILSWPRIKNGRTDLVVQVTSVTSGDTLRAATGRLLLTIQRETTVFAIGDEITFESRLRTPYPALFPGQFDYKEYLRHQQIRTIATIRSPQSIFMKPESHSAGRLVAELRRLILEALDHTLAANSSALASGLLIGETRHIRPETYKQFRRSGTMHLLAVSGSNVALVIATMLVVLHIIVRWRIIRLLLLLGVVYLFCQLSMNEPSVVRASVMASLVIMGMMGYRRINLHNIIAAAGVMILLISPRMIFDVGFQLSFAVTWALVLVIPPLHRMAGRWRIRPFVRFAVLVGGSSLVATIAAAPITLATFGEISIVSIAANLIVVPLVSVAVTAIICLIFLYLLWPPLAGIAGGMVDILLTAIEHIVSRFGDIPGAMWEVGPISGSEIVWLAALAMLLLGSIVYHRVRRLALLFVIVSLVVIPLSKALGHSEEDSVGIYNTGSTMYVTVISEPSAIIAVSTELLDFDDLTMHVIPSLQALNKSPDFVVLREWTFQARRRLEHIAERFPELPVRPVMSGGYPSNVVVADCRDRLTEWDIDEVLAVDSGGISVLLVSGMTLSVITGEITGYNRGADVAVICADSAVQVMRYAQRIDAGLVIGAFRYEMDLQSIENYGDRHKFSSIDIWVFPHSRQHLLLH